MSTPRYVIALDQGTTSSRAALVDRAGHMVDVVQRPFQQIFPQPGWVEHNPQEILFSQIGCLTELVARHGLTAADVAAIGIDNQRETTIVWDPSTGAPVTNAIVWQCRRTADMVERLCGSPEVRETVRAKTGLLPDAYFSASKIAWILENVPSARERAEAGELLFGTVDTWLIWVLTGGLVHATDPTNASRTMLYNIHEGRWDEELLALFGVPASMMPEVRPSSGFFGETSYPGLPAGIPVTGVAGDQQSALFGQCCFDAGQAKNTYGTGCFMLINTGDHAVTSQQGLVATIGIAEGERVSYALEGSIFHAGSTMQWLRDGLGIISDVRDTAQIAESLADNNGCYLVPAFSGLGAPWWEPEARGMLSGLTLATGRAQIVRAACESLAYQSYDVLRAMEADAQMTLDALYVDGGASRNEFIMQFQADLLDIPVIQSETQETTAIGVAFLAGLSVGYWEDREEIKQNLGHGRRFDPQMPTEVRARNLDVWHKAVSRVR